VTSSVVPFEALSLMLVWCTGFAKQGFCLALMSHVSMFDYTWCDDCGTPWSGHAPCERLQHMFLLASSREMYPSLSGR